MSLFPNSIKIRITDTNNEAIPAIAVMIRLFAKHKNDYYFVPGISNEGGIIEIKKEWISEQIENMRNFFIMDYASTLEDCYSKIEIEIMDKNEVKNAIEGRILYKDIMNIPENEIENLLKSINEKYVPITKIVELHKPQIEEIELIIKKI